MKKHQLKQIETISNIFPKTKTLTRAYKLVRGEKKGEWLRKSHLIAINVNHARRIRKIVENEMKEGKTFEQALSIAATKYSNQLKAAYEKTKMTQDKKVQLENELEKDTNPIEELTETEIENIKKQIEFEPPSETTTVKDFKNE